MVDTSKTKNMAAVRTQVCSYLCPLTYHWNRLCGSFHHISHFKFALKLLSVVCLRDHAVADVGESTAENLEPLDQEESDTFITVLKAVDFAQDV